MERIIFDPKNLLLVDINSVRPNTWNPKDKETEEFQMIKRGIDKKGFVCLVSTGVNRGK